MLNLNKTTLIVGAVCLALGFSLSKYYFPSVQIKTVEVTKEVVQNNIKTVTRTVERKDGSKETITESVDKSSKKETSKSETIIAKKSEWLVSVGASSGLSDFVPVYDIHVQRRIAGPLFVGVRASTKEYVGVSVGLEF